MRIGGPGAVEIVKRGVARDHFSDPYHIAIEISWKEFALAFVGLEVSQAE
jgi:inward rectifier potassium channel